MSSKRLFLVHWNGPEARAMAAPLRAAGWTVSIESKDGARAWKSIRARRPDTLVISMRRLPSHGRRTGMVTGTRKDLRSLPVFFVDTAPDQKARAKAAVPGAKFVTSKTLMKSLKRRRR